MAHTACQQMHHLRKVSRVFRIVERAQTNGVWQAWPAWPSQLLHGVQQRGYIAGAEARPPAFVFDIDGVLVRGKRVLDPAKRAFERLYKDGGQTPRYPICFLTNGGGMTEQQKADELSSWLGVHVRESQVVLSHTPFRSLLPSLKGPVMVSGMGNVVEVARHYGFKQILTPLDVARAIPSIVPFWKDKAGCAAEAASERGQCPVKNLGYGSEESRIKTVLVFKDPSDWYVDLQVITDVCVGGGVIGKWKPEMADQAVKVYFSNPDLLFAGEHPAPRLGQGGFAAALKTLVTEVTGRELNHEFMGKPNAAPYELAEHILFDQALELGLIEQQESPSDGEHSPANTADQDEKTTLDSAGGYPGSPFSAIYAVGDNPKADIAGALNARAQGRPYVAVLVRTGVFSGEQANDEEFPADVVVWDVDAAVQAALHRTRSMRWHSMR